MCEQCAPRAATALSRRGALGLLAGATLALLPRRNPAAATAGVSPVAVTDNLTVLPRAAWAGDLAPRGPMSSEDVRFLLVHHTAGSNDVGADDVVPTLRSIYDFHTGAAKSWPDVAYNFFIDPFGVVWEGRAGSIAGPVVADATEGSQGFAQLVCLLGDFTSHLPTPEAHHALVRTLAWLAERDAVAVGVAELTTFESRGSNRWPAGAIVETTTIAGHRDMSATACPGDAFYPLLRESVIGEVAALLAEATPATSTQPASPVEPPPATTAETAPPTTAPAETSAEPAAELASAPAPADLARADTTGLDAESTGGNGGGRTLLVAAASATGVAATAGALAARRRRQASADGDDQF